MAGRISYVLVAAAALVGGMYFQGDLDFDDHHAAVSSEIRDRTIDRRIDRRIDRIVDRETRQLALGDDGQSEGVDPATRRALSQAVAELIRAEAGLATVRLDDEVPAAVIDQAEQRRDRARQAVDRLADDARAGSRSDRDALRQTIREEVRAAIRG